MPDKRPALTDAESIQPLLNLASLARPRFGVPWSMLQASTLAIPGEWARQSSESLEQNNPVSFLERVYNTALSPAARIAGIYEGNKQLIEDARESDLANANIKRMRSEMGKGMHVVRPEVRLASRAILTAAPSGNVLTAIPPVSH